MNRLLHRLRGHRIERKRCHWYSPPGETPRGPYDLYSCNCSREWVVNRPDQLVPIMWQF